MEDIKLIKNVLFEDERGTFTEAWRNDIGLPDFKQCNVSVSREHVVRGLHYQVVNPQGKLVRVLFGEIIDVVVDLRVGSANYGKAQQYTLDSGGNSIYVPPGFAHGFWVISKQEAVLQYFCTELYHPESDTGINPVHSMINLPWDGGLNFFVSEKDRSLPVFDKKFVSPF